MGDGLMVILFAVAIIFGVGSIFTAIWSFIMLYQANRRKERLKCSCGRQALLYNNDTQKTVVYAYMCQCGVKGFIGGNKDEAFYGWVLRRNKQAYFDYLVAKKR